MPGFPCRPVDSLSLKVPNIIRQLMSVVGVKSPLKDVLNCFWSPTYQEPAPGQPRTVSLPTCILSPPSTTHHRLVKWPLLPTANLRNLIQFKFNGVSFGEVLSGDVLILQIDFWHKYSQNIAVAIFISISFQIKTSYCDLLKE